MSAGGKGHAPRPFSVSQAEYRARWDAIFGRDEDATADEPPRKAPAARSADDELIYDVTGIDLAEHGTRRLGLVTITPSELYELLAAARGQR